jgi:hypothetical protein
MVISSELCPIPFRLCDISPLTALRPSAEHDYSLRAASSEINSVSWTHVNTQLEHVVTNALVIAKVANLDRIETSLHSSCRDER